MDAQTKIIRASHMIDMNDIIREGNPTLRAVAEDVTFPLSDEDIILGEKMMQFLRNSQDPVIAEKMGLRGESVLQPHNWIFQNALSRFSFQTLKTLKVIHQKKPIAFKKSCTTLK